MKHQKKNCPLDPLIKLSKEVMTDMLDIIDRAKDEVDIYLKKEVLSHPKFRYLEEEMKNADNSSLDSEIVPENIPNAHKQDMLGYEQSINELSTFTSKIFYLWRNISETLISNIKVYQIFGKTHQQMETLMKTYKTELKKEYEKNPAKRRPNLRKISIEIDKILAGFKSERNWSKIDPKSNEYSNYMIELIYRFFLRNSNIKKKKIYTGKRINYEGEWKSVVWDGEGLGAKIKAGGRHGFGVEYSWGKYEGKVYVGEWKDNIRCGYGVKFIHGKDIVAEGEFEKNHIINGKYCRYDIFKDIKFKAEVRDGLIFGKVAVYDLQDCFINYRYDFDGKKVDSL